MISEMVQDKRIECSNSLIIRREAIASPSIGKTLKASFDGLHAAYYSAKSEPIWVKFGKLSAECWGMAMADFGRNPCTSDCLKGS